MRSPFSAWNPFKKKGAPQETHVLPDIPEISASDNEWGVPLLDVRPFTRGMISMTSELLPAAIALSYKYCDGPLYAGHAPVNSRDTEANLQYRVTDQFVDGALFIPSQMEHKWAIYYHGGTIIFVRSWMGREFLVADVNVEDGVATINHIKGTLWDENDGDDIDTRAVDFLLRSYVLGEEYPAPIPEILMHMPGQAAKLCMNIYGLPAAYATSSKIQRTIPDKVMKCYPLLHAGAMEGDVELVGGLLDSGAPVDLPDPTGQSALEWAVPSEQTVAADLLLSRGADINHTADDGRTLLKGVVQAKNTRMVEFLLQHGADPNIADNRGFTALHVAAELGLFDISKLLLNHGARMDFEAGGHTPRSLADLRGHRTIVGLMDKRMSEGQA